MRPFFSPARRNATALALLLGFAGLNSITAAYAALPVAVDGQPLPSLAPMLERVVPAVVNINSKTHVRVNNPFMNDPFFRQFFGMQNMPRERVEQSLGSGVIIDASKGYVLTNNHVIDGADDISVTLHDGRTLKAKLIGSDRDTDIAVIQIPAENLTALNLMDSAQLRVGDFVVALGNPFGVGQTATSGIVSGLNRTGLRGLGIQNFIQTDASINPGNSGGALVNLKGELVGINSAIFSPSGGNVGIGFAIPSNLASNVMNQIITTGSVRHGSLGAQVQSVTPEIARMLGVKEDQQGAVVTQVRDDSPAANAGLQSGDVIVAANGRPVQNESDLYNAEGLAAIGSTIDLKLLRDGKPVTVNARIEAEKVASSEGAKLDARLTGATLADVSDRARADGKSGVSVVSVAAGSRAAQIGLKAGDVIFGIGNRRIGTLADFTQLMKRVQRLQVQLAVVRGGDTFLVTLQ
ncbi:MAG: DegQ family serine endoprotease [Rudaea sp.]|uniref:DegQ family serine endoprotease n=1 Tax=unclassified Rudaea TaxID=2627037 RepID=UPI0010F5AE69|nr:MULTISPECIES: DegQ family serine endoprotease [unclassified Rudaea]MBN8885554.1 DegQ family serine endoprotease [Rudaea sp.]